MVFQGAEQRIQGSTPGGGEQQQALLGEQLGLQCQLRLLPLLPLQQQLLPCHGALLPLLLERR